MWPDILTKPLQGQQFKQTRAFLQSCAVEYDDDAECKKDELKEILSHTTNQQVNTVASPRECVDCR